MIISYYYASIYFPNNTPSLISSYTLKNPNGQLKNLKTQEPRNLNYQIQHDSYLIGENTKPSCVKLVNKNGTERNLVSFATVGKSRVGFGI